MAEAEDRGQSIDAVFIALGWRGRYQLLQIFQAMLASFPTAFTVLAIVFIGRTNEHVCKDADNSTSHLVPPDDVINVTYGACSVTWTNVTGEEMETPCPNGLQFADPVDYSLMSEWGLVCGKEALTDMSQSLLLAGMMVGAMLFTSLADRYGRKPLHVLCSLGLLIVGVASAFVPTFTAFLSLRFFVGAFQQGTGMTFGIMCLEILPTRRRFTVTVVGTIVWGIAMVVLGFLAFLMQHYSWRYLQLLIAASSAYSFLMIWFLDESLRWLVANGKVDQAERILKKAAVQNKVSAEDVLTVFRTKALRQQQSSDGHHHHPKQEELCVSTQHPESSLNPSASDDKQDLPRYGLLDIVKNKHVFMCIVINGFVWFVNGVTYYGLSMTSVTFTDDMYLGFFLSAVVELPAVIVFFFVEKYGRKRCCDVFHVLAALSLLTSVTVSSLAGHSQASSIAVLILSLLGKFAISATFGVLILYTTEQFPTNLRNTSLGVASMAGRAGGMIAPYSRTLVRHYPWAPGTIFGVCCLLLPLCMRLLPETCGRELPQTIEQMEAYITDKDHVSKRSGKNKKSEIV